MFFKTVFTSQFYFCRFGLVCDQFLKRREDARKEQICLKNG